MRPSRRSRRKVRSHGTLRPRDRRELLVAHRRAADVDALRPRGCAGRAPGSRRSRLHRHALVLLLAGFRPEARDLDEQVIDRFSDFLDAHAELGLETIPTFIVGHMSGRTGIHPGDTDAISTATSGSWASRRGSSRRSSAVPPARGRRLAPLERDAALRRARASVPEVTAWARILTQAVRAGARRSRFRSATAPGAWRSPARTTAIR